MLCNDSVSSSSQERILNVSIRFLGDLQNFTNKTTLLPKILAVRVKFLKKYTQVKHSCVCPSPHKNRDTATIVPKNKSVKAKHDTQNLQYIFTFVQRLAITFTQYGEAKKQQTKSRTAQLGAKHAPCSAPMLQCLGESFCFTEEQDRRHCH